MSGARPDTWMPLYWGDYLRDTGHLTDAEHGSYFLLIGHYWCTGEPLPDDDRLLARLARCSGSAWKKRRPIIAHFFQIDGGEWHHKRIDKELTRSQQITDMRAAAGRASAQQRANTRATHVAGLLGDVLQQTAIPIQPQSQSPIEDASASSGKQANGHDRKARGTRLAADWQPSAEDIDFARQMGLNPTTTADEFRDFWIGVAGAKGVKLDWSATFRNRCRQLVERASLQRPGSQPTPGEYAPIRKPRAPRSPPPAS